MLGERYGWIPPPDGYAADLLERQPWLKKHQGGKSVTELEILHGVLKNKRMKSRAFFYFRSPAYARAKGGHYVPDSTEDRQRQLDLKRRIKDSGYSVTAYRDPEALAKRMERDLWKLLDAEFPAFEVPKAFEREAMRHEAYAAPKRRPYLGGDTYIKALNALLKKNANRVLITGQSGGGKSALLANALAKHHGSKTHLLEHYLGSSSDAADTVAMVRRVIEYIRRVTGNTDPVAVETEELFESVPTWLKVASAYAKKNRTHWLFVFDSLNNLNGYRDLQWFPADLPERIQIVVSCLEGEVKEALDAKGEWDSLVVEPLDPNGQRQLLTEYLKRFNKSLSVDLLSQALEHPLANNPLWLKTLAEELRLFGSHEELSNRLNTLLGPPKGKDENELPTLDDLFEHVLQRIEADHGRKLVRDALCAIWASRAGLSEPELLEILAPHSVTTGKAKKANKLPPAQWAPVRNALDEMLLESGGRIIFAHDYVKAAVKDRYLPRESLQRNAHKKLAEHFAKRMGDGRVAEELPWQLNAAGAYQSLRRCLQGAGVFLHMWNRFPIELLSYWQHRWDRENLQAIYEKAYCEWMITSPAKLRQPLKVALADALWEYGIYSPVGAQLQRAACTVTARRFGAKSLEVARRYLQCAYYLRHLADPLSLRFAKKAVLLLEPNGPSFDLVESYALMAAVSDADGRGWEARSISAKALCLLDSLPDGMRKHRIRHTVLLGWYNTAYPMEALPVFEDLVKVETSVFGSEHRRSLESVDIQVDCLMALDRWAEASNLAMSLYQRCYRTFGEDHVQTAYAAGKYGKSCLNLNDLDSAEWGLAKASRILRETFPEGHQSRLTFLEPLAETYSRLGRTLEAASTRSQLEESQIACFFDHQSLVIP
jgi:hypothetical protein